MTFGIIGYGRFGKFWAEQIRQYGTVYVYDVQDISNQLKGVSGVQQHSLETVVQTDILFLTMPISKLVDVCQKIFPMLKLETLVVDVCSVKMYAAEVMLAELPNQQPIIATHPLFGPQTVKRQGIQGQKIVVDSLTASEQQLQELVKLLNDLQLKVIMATSEQNDQAMAYSHALLYYLGRALAALDLQEQEICTPDYSKLLTIQELVKNNSWELFSDLENRNPFAAEVRAKFVQELLDLETRLSEEEKASELECVRAGIDKVDVQLIGLLARRLKLAKQAGDIKRGQHKKIYDAKREQEILQKYVEIAKGYDLDPHFVQDLFIKIISESKRLQKKDEQE